MGSKPTMKTWGRGEKRPDLARKAGRIEVCKYRFIKLAPVARALTLSDPREARGKQESPDGI